MDSTFDLHPITPFRLDYTVFALRRRSKNNVDLWDGGRYMRLLVIENELLQVTIEQKSESQIAVTVNKNLNHLVQEKLSLKLEQLLGLKHDLGDFYQLAQKDPALHPLINQFLGLKPPRFPSIFEALVNAISCQQISLDAGLHIQNRLTEYFGNKHYEKEQVLYAFPSPYDLANCSIAELRAIGYSHNKSETLLRLASIMRDDAEFAHLENKSNNEVMSFLCQLKGIGRWSAEYVLLRGLGRVDTFPGDDIGAQNNLSQLLHLDSKPDYKKIAEITAKWQPYAGLVYFHLLLQKLHEKEAI